MHLIVAQVKRLQNGGNYTLILDIEKMSYDFHVRFNVVMSKPRAQCKKFGELIWTFDYATDFINEHTILFTEVVHVRKVPSGFTKAFLIA